jgi:hypothetical protein
VAHYLAQHGESRAAKAVLISALPPLMVKTASNPGGLPKAAHRTANNTAFASLRRRPRAATLNENLPITSTSTRKVRPYGLVPK